MEANDLADLKVTIQRGIELSRLNLASIIRVDLPSHILERNQERAILDEVWRIIPTFSSGEVDLLRSSRKLAGGQEEHYAACWSEARNTREWEILIPLATPLPTIETAIQLPPQELPWA